MSRKRLWIKNPLAILAADAGGGLVIEGSVIQELIPSGGAPSFAVDETFEASNHVVLPGLINTHHHFFQNLTKAHPAAANKKLFSWLGSMYPFWGRLTPEAFRLANRLALTELLLSGCTTAVDHHYLYPRGLDNSVDIQVDEAHALGMRAVITRGSMSDRIGGYTPWYVTQEDDVILEDSERVLQTYHDTSPGAMTQIALAPCSPFNVTERLMRETAALAEKYDARMHIHTGETFDEINYCESVYGKRPLDYLESVGWVTDRVWLAHGIHFTDSEIARLGNARVGVAHCPTSNMVLASGQCRTLELEEAGSAVGLGVDGSASNDNSNLMESVRHALMINRLTYGAEAISPLDALRWGTDGSARCLGRRDLGRLQIGCEADIALFKLDDLRFSGSHDPLAALVLCGAHTADRVMVAGKWQVVDSHPVAVDVKKLVREHSKLATKLFAT